MIARDFFFFSSRGPRKEGGDMAMAGAPAWRTGSSRQMIVPRCRPCGETTLVASYLVTKRGGGAQVKYSMANAAFFCSVLPLSTPPLACDMAWHSASDVRGHHATGQHATGLPRGCCAALRERERDSAREGLWEC